MSYLVSFCSYSIAITSLGEDRANLSTFRTFVRFVLVSICQFPLPLGVWEGLRFVIVASLELSLTLPYLFFFFFFFLNAALNFHLYMKILAESPLCPWEHLKHPLIFCFLVPTSFYH